MSRLDPRARVYGENCDGEINGGMPVPCMWFAKCTNEANGLRDGGPLGDIPICCRCDDRMERMAADAS